MKSLLSIFILIIVQFNFLNAQSLTVTDIKYAFENNLKNIDNYLSLKKFNLLKTDNEGCGSVKWVNKNYSEFIGKTCTTNQSGFVLYMFYDASYYKYLEKYLDDNFKYLDTFTTDKGNLYQICSKYSGRSYVLESCKVKSENTNASSWFTVKISKH